MSKKKILLKIVIGGDAAVGKTSIMDRYVRNVFNCSYKPTIGADFMTTEIHIDGRPITVQLWDTAGQERFKSLGVTFYQGADAFIAVYDVNTKESFENINKYMKDFTQFYDGKLEQVPVLIFGNKIDQKKATVAKKEAVQLVETRGENTLFYEISCKNDADKSIIDSAFVELCKLCIDKHPGIKSIFESDNESDEGEINVDNNDFIRMPREMNPAMKQNKHTETLCGGPNSNCLMSSSSDAFCHVL